MNRNDLLAPFSRHRIKRSPMQGVLPGVGLFGTGMLVGAGVALLLAPKSGARLRAEISQKSEKFKRQVTERTQELLNGEVGNESESRTTEDGVLTDARTLDMDRAQSLTNDDVSDRASAVS